MSGRALQAGADAQRALCHPHNSPVLTEKRPANTRVCGLQEGADAKSLQIPSDEDGELKGMREKTDPAYLRYASLDLF